MVDGLSPGKTFCSSDIGLALSCLGHSFGQYAEEWQMSTIRLSVCEELAR